MLRRLFLDHPASVDETYFEHMAIAGRFGLTMVAGGVACLAHALLPAVFPKTASDTVRGLNAQLQARRDRFRRDHAAGEWVIEYEI